VIEAFSGTKPLFYPSLKCNINFLSLLPVEIPLANQPENLGSNLEEHRSPSSIGLILKKKEHYMREGK